MAAVLPSLPVRLAPAPRPRWWLALPAAAAITVSVAVMIVTAVIPPARDIWVKQAHDAGMVVPALWAVALANLVIAGLLAAAWRRRWVERSGLRRLLAVLGAGGFLQALALVDAAAAFNARDPRLEAAIAWCRLAALGAATAGLLVLSATLRPLQRLWGGLVRLLPALAAALLFVVLLAAGPWALAAMLSLALGLTVILYAWRTRAPESAPRLPGLPATRPGLWAAWLLSGFALCFAVFLWAVTLGARGGDSFFSNPFLATSLLLASGLAVAAGVAAAVAVVARHERSHLVTFALVLGLLATVFALGEVLAPHERYR